MSLFRRPDESSSESDSSSNESEDEEIETSRGSGGTEEEIGADLTQTETLSTNDFSITENEDGPSIPDADRHRNLLLAALLEEFYKTRAAEMMNEMHPGSGFNRTSPEIQDFARTMFMQMSQNMATAGLLQAESVMEEQRHVRKTYVAGLDQIRLQDFTDSELLSTPEGRRLSAAAASAASNAANPSTALVRSSVKQPVPFTGTMRGQLDQLAYEARGLSMIPQPHADLQLYQSSYRQYSHYRSTFQEKSLLGRGGFGRVYHSYNVFDNCEYAVKKIPLSPKLSHKYRIGGHPELAHMLSEVQALARLDHCNVVRYYATWIEEPTIESHPHIPALQHPTFGGRRLLEHRSRTSHHPVPSQGRVIQADHLDIADDDDPFDRDDGDDAAGPQWSYHANTDNHASTSALPDSDIFSDGGHQNVHRSRESFIDDPSVYILHVQMSMYPTTLAQYIAPINSPRAKSGRSKLHHCFHLIPTLRILLGILAGVQYIHSRGMIHRDIKPSNIFMSAMDYTSPSATIEGFVDVGKCRACNADLSRAINPRIGDFGLVADLERAAAAAADEKRRSSLGHNRSNSGSEKAVGTEYYRPPPTQPAPLVPATGTAAEHQNGTNTNASAHKSTKLKSQPHPTNESLDVFALGIVLIELLCPCSTRMERVEMLSECQNGRAPICLKQRLLEFESCPIGVIERVEECVHGMIHMDPRFRWSCNLIRDVVEEILSRYDSNNEEEEVL